MQIAPARQSGQSAQVQRSKPLRLVRRWRFLSPSARLQFRLHRMTTGHVFGGDGSSLLIGFVAYAVRLVTLPLAIVGDWIAVPILRALDRDSTSWWVVEVRFHSWDAEFVRIAEADTEQEARARLASINSA